MAVLVGLGAAAPAVRRYCRRAGLRLEVDEDDVALHLRWPTTPYWTRRGVRAYTWALGVPRGTHPDEVRARYEAPGLVLTPARALVHAGRFASYALYARPVATGWAVSDVADVPELLDPAGLQPDWEAWATQLVFWSKMHEGTSTVGTSRLSWGTGLSLDRRTAQIARPARVFRPVVEDATVSPDVVAQALVAAAEKLPDTEPIDLPLSGGLDSRALALALSRAGRRFRTWTISKDDGRTDEQTIAAAVAERLRVRHDVVEAHGRVSDDLATTMRRTQYASTLHGWVLPLYAMLRERGGTIVDGLLGETLLRSLSSRPWVLDKPSENQLAELRDSYTYRLPPHPLLTKNVPDFARRAAHAAFAATTAPLAGTPAELTLAAMIARGSYTVACAPLGLGQGPARVALPFLDPDLVDLALAVPERLKSDTTFYRRVIARLDPDVAELPSTVEARPEPTMPERNRSPEAVLFHRQNLLAAGEVPGLLSRRFVDRLHRGDIDEWTGLIAPSYGISVPTRSPWIGGLSVLGQWLRDHEPVVTTPVPWER